MNESVKLYFRNKINITTKKKEKTNQKQNKLKQNKTTKMPTHSTASGRLWRQNKALFMHKKCLDKHQIQADLLTSSKRWWLIDATKIPTGRLATEVAKILLGMCVYV